MNKFIMFSFLILFLTGCTDKETIYEDEHIIEIVEGNDPPPYNGVTTVELNNYINKIYIDLFGREPNSSELSSTADLLRQGNIGDVVVEQFLNSLINSQDYYNRFNDIYIGSMLNSTDSEAVTAIYNLLVLQLQSATDPLEILRLQREIEKLDNLQNAKSDYQLGNITINNYMIRLAFNFFYDEINMGSENFVLACFENFFKRLPTEEELENSKTMVDGFPAQLLMTDGATKFGFLEILTSNDEFYQGLAIDIYIQLLARNPDSIEMGEATSNLSQGSWTYQDLQKEVIKTEEYKGF